MCLAIKKPIFGAKLMFIAMHDDDNVVDGDDDELVAARELPFPPRCTLPLPSQSRLMKTKCQWEKLNAQPPCATMCQ